MFTTRTSSSSSVGILPHLNMFTSVAQSSKKREIRRKSLKKIAWILAIICLHAGTVSFCLCSTKQATICPGFWQSLGNYRKTWNERRGYCTSDLHIIKNYFSLIWKEHSHGWTVWKVSPKFLNFVVCNPCQSSPSLTILVPLWFIIISLVFFYLC